ncbi:MAG TPA: hypothetical protein DHW39_12070 [Erysipelotrichaceae bacterium]|nr:hypothetical protein [Erysipelotrichaceae bacterium]
MAKKRKVNWKPVTWLILLVSAVILYFVLTGFIVFPKRFKTPLLILLAALVLLMAVFSFLTKKKGKIVPIINGVLAAFMLIVCAFLPFLEAKLRGIFTDTGDTEEFVMNVYAFTSEYKAAHPEIFTDTNASTEITDYSDKRFIIQEAMDLENQQYALEELKKTFSKDVQTVSKMDVLDAVTSFYNGEGECLILNEVFEESVEELEGFENFKADVQIIKQITREVAVEPTPTPDSAEKGLKPFTILVAGEDTRSSKLKVYGRTDVDIVMTVNPDTKQILVAGFPRDTYLKNPALRNGMDKLTHLGNNGIQNTAAGLGAVLNTEISEYFVVNFRTFKNIIDAMGGIDIDNPYKFTTGANIGVHTFREGNIHINGEEALLYCRERKHLPNGDYGRSEHQTIVLKAVVDKLTSPELLTNFSALLDSLQGQFITSYSTDNIYQIVQNQLDNNTPWNIISYHLTGRGDMQPTASMGAQKLYVNWLYAQQVEFIRGEMTKVLNGETVTQGELPADDTTIFTQN